MSRNSFFALGRSRTSLLGAFFLSTWLISLSLDEASAFSQPVTVSLHHRDTRIQSKQSQRWKLHMAATVKPNKKTSTSTLLNDETVAATATPSELTTAQTIPSTMTMPELSLPSSGEDNTAEYRRGLLTIGFITLLFASNSPALHFALSSASMTAPPVLLLNAAVSVVALVGLLFGGSLLEASTPLPSTLLRNQQKSTTDKQDTSIIQLQAGLELGLWKFLGTTANLYGLSLTTADHGAFLVQLTTLIVPVVQGIMGVPIPKRIQFSVALALAGVFMFTQDPTMCAGAQAAGESVNQVLTGDALCIVAAGFYATYDLRLFSWGKLVTPRKLITTKIATQALFSVLLLAGLGWTESADFVSNALSSGSANELGLLALLVLWSGVAVNAVAPFLQVGGQQAVGPTRAQTLYASQPLWASMISYVALGETVGMQGAVGGIAFLTALALAATAKAPDPECEQPTCEV